MNNRQLLTLSRALQGQSAAEVDARLREHHLDPQERIAVKHAISAAATSRAMQATAANRSGPFAPATEMGRLWRRLGLVDGQTMTLAELEQRMTALGLDPQQRIAVKYEAGDRGLLATAPHETNVAARYLEHLGIEGPVDLWAIEQRMDREGWSVTAKNVVKSELHMRGWLRGGGNVRTMQASASRPVRLVDGRGQPITLRSLPE
jgi:hypothetical protein